MNFIFQNSLILILLFLFSTTITISPMNTNSTSTFRTRSSHFFISNKFSYAVFFNISKIYDHAHIVFSSVSFIQMFQIIAGKIVTSKTKLCFSFLENFTVYDFTSNNGNGFIGICSPATGAFIFFSQISHASATVHATGSDK